MPVLTLNGVKPVHKDYLLIIIDCIEYAFRLHATKGDDTLDVDFERVILVKHNPLPQPALESGIVINYQGVTAAEYLVNSIIDHAKDHALRHSNVDPNTWKVRQSHYSYPHDKGFVPVLCVNFEDRLIECRLRPL